MSPAELDCALLVAARTHFHPPWLERAAARYSRAGDHGACWLALAVAGAVLNPGERAHWFRAGRVVAGANAVNYAVKLTVRRRRPELNGLPPLTKTVSRLSFPSAHCTMSFAAARAFDGLVPSAVLYGAALGFALSRPYLGVHYPSDVLAGAVLGTAIGEAWPQ